MNYILGIFLWKKGLRFYDTENGEYFMFYDLLFCGYVF